MKEVPMVALINAAQFVRNKYNLDRGYVISDKFEQEFGIKIHATDDVFGLNDDIEFSSEGHYIMFLLKWSE